MMSFVRPCLIFLWFFLITDIAHAATRNVPINSVWYRGDDVRLVVKFFQTPQEACIYDSSREPAGEVWKYVVDQGPYQGHCEFYWGASAGGGYAGTLRNAYSANGFVGTLCSEDGVTSLATSSSCVGGPETDVHPGPLSKPDNLGPTCESCTPSVLHPINPTTGNMWHVEEDYVTAAPSSSLALRRTYNSTLYNWDFATVRSFGVRWTQPYDAILKPEQAFTPGVSPGTCWQSSDTQIIVCDGPAAPTASGIPAAVSILRGDGKKYLFNRSGAAWVGDTNINDRVTAIYNAANTAVIGWTYVTAQGDVTERYDANGLLTAIVARNGATQLVTRSNGATNDSIAGRVPADAPVCGHVQAGAVLPAGRVMCVTDQAGRQVQFEYDTKGRISKAFDPAGQAFLYEYDGVSGGCMAAAPSSAACNADNLTKVTYPDGNSHMYYYNEAAQINGGAVCAGTTPVGNGYAHLLSSWTGLVDENGVRHISWTYDCSGRATSSELGAGIGKAVLDYSDATATTITHMLGTPNNPQTTVISYGITQVLGVAKNSVMSDRCVECGDVAVRTFDANGNLASTKDWNGNYTCYAYDLTRNLETARVEGTTSAACASLLTASSLTAPARKVSTQWHAGYRLPLVVAEPKKRTTYSYDTSGNLLSVAEQATSDETGAQGFSAALVGTPRTRSYTYNALGQPLTAKGPRTDVDDTVTYSYDSQNNLASVTNAAKQKTALDNYDANGRVGRVVTPSGVVTEFTYTPRGWLASRTVTADGVVERTGYDYDGAGQLARVTLPDGASVTYTYDDAHRLTGVADSLGNSVVYTLDLRGNRIKEQVNDPTGALGRQTSRVYDTLNRLQQQTGAIQ